MQDDSTLANAGRMLPRSVAVWLYIGVFMVFVQVIIGGITRLTDSGLSITEWNVIKGTLPPLNEVQWQDAFDKYQEHAKKQFESLHRDMTLSEFKVIYFWEYFHRLWARSMGFVFLIPFLLFWRKKVMPVKLMKRLGIVVLLAGLAATFGWIMVASGLNDDKRTWVSAYKLVVHLGIATVLFGYLLWTTFLVAQPLAVNVKQEKLKRLAGWIVVLVFVQIAFGGLMAGMRAGLLHPHFPFFVQGSGFYDALTKTQELSSSAMVDYEPGQFLKAVVQVLHRATAYIVTAVCFLFFIRVRKQADVGYLNIGAILLITMVVIQFLLGVYTILYCIGRVPATLGVLHQAGALALFAIALFNYYQFRSSKGILLEAQD